MTDAPRRRGRPRTFDSAEALDRAVLLFWKHGYEGTSIADLTEAMGVTAPTLYAAFGSKEELYEKVLAHYVERHGGRERSEALCAEPSVYIAIETYLRASARQLADPSVPAGCFVSTSMLFCAEENKSAARSTAALRAQTIEMLHSRFDTAKREGQLPVDCDAAALARYFASIAQGMSVQASDGATLEDLESTVDLALAAWPGERLGSVRN